MHESGLAFLKKMKTDAGDTLQHTSLDSVPNAFEASLDNSKQVLVNF